ncbi:hypothetical protein BH09DEP1_BH09DEP1_8350 [soil metagenome]
MKKIVILTLSLLAAAPKPFQAYIPTKELATAAIGPSIYCSYKALKGSKKHLAALKAIGASLLACYTFVKGRECCWSRYPEQAIFCGFVSCLSGIIACGLIDSTINDLNNTEFINNKLLV